MPPFRSPESEAVAREMISRSCANRLWSEFFNSLLIARSSRFNRGDARFRVNLRLENSGAKKPGLAAAKACGLQPVEALGAVSRKPSMSASTPSAFISVRGHSLEYRRIGAADPGKPTLVFLHEGLGSIGQWRDFTARIARATGLPALVYARYGYGQSQVLQRPF